MAKKKEPRLKVTVSLPTSLLARLDGKVPARKRSEFIAHAIEEQLAIIEQAEAIEAAAGAWKDEDHPDLATDEDIDRWIANLRGGVSGKPLDRVADSGQEYELS
jgi:hypothetical protein